MSACYFRLKEPFYVAQTFYIEVKLAARVRPAIEEQLVNWVAHPAGSCSCWLLWSPKEVHWQKAKSGLIAPICSFKMGEQQQKIYLNS